jgi:hypothetical protein
MTLSPETKYPNRRTYVIRVRSDARPYLLAGRLEGLITGRSWDFASGHELLTALVRDIEAQSEASAGGKARD